MAVDYLRQLAARVRARFHVQVQLTLPDSVFQTPAAIPVKGRVLRVFRSDGTLKVDDEVMFSVHVCRLGDDILIGISYTLYENFMRANCMEVFLNGYPPQ